MARPLWFVKLLKKVFPKVKLIAKLTNVPILGKLFDFILFRGDDIIYLPQDKAINLNKSLGEYEEFVLPSQVLEYFIYKAKNHWVMNFCICRSSMDCQDYPAELGCLFLGDAVLDINPQLGRLVTKEQALEHLRKCREAGLVQMIGRNRLDAQWLGVSPGEKLLSICNCDPCCCLWRVSSILAPKIGSKIKKMPGVVVRVNDKCIGCGTCVKGICFVNAINLKDNRAVITQECRGCGRCVSVCPQNAIELLIDDEKFVKKSIKEIDNIIDVA
ncbi:MAG: DUF362 domain-containing protein [Candidatus Thorarchaeota archaeon]